MIKNPVSGRNIKVGGDTYRSLIHAGYFHIGSDLVKTNKPIVDLNPPFPIDTVPLIFSYLRMTDILNGHLINRLFANILTKSFRCFGKSILYMLFNTPRNKFVLLYQLKDIMSDSDIYHFLWYITTKEEYSSCIHKIQILCYNDGRLVDYMNKLLLFRVGMTMDEYKQRNGIENIKEEKSYYYNCRFYNKNYNKITHCAYELDLKDLILNGKPSLSIIKSTCMKFGLSGYTKITKGNKQQALEEIRKLF